ncbi:fumarylacetoacetate hydrolase family protein [Agromyces larvae]|uniref:Fumarylacetoacetate hydrolase family protein n=1 Tax=Agromyces larvae TaxID=2929802 RepID=A0ABY4BZK6_9MICO|nr:fumarylacetoacetate hydrolase family protein [Agromyces larvae]UOE44678.1 fumarylacetoacetate hydrolase family protein [Agromyces larvae]
MRFAHLRVEGRSIPRLAVVSGDGALFLDEVMGDEAPRDLQELIERGDPGLEHVRAIADPAIADGGRLVPLADLRYSSAVLRPPQVLAIGANYAAHASELKLRSETAMTIFSLWPNSLTGHGQTTTWPEDLSTQVDYEAELGVIIGRPARGVHVRDALDSVWGYTVVNDITARDIQFSEAQWSRCKSFDGFTPTGPVVVTADEIADPQDLWLTTNVDGRVLQDASTTEMVRGVAEIVSYLSRSATIPPGTLISTGSPGGAGYSRTPQVFLHDGATVTVTIEGIGSLTTHCRVI